MKYQVKTKDARTFVKAHAFLREHFDEREIEKFKRAVPMGFMTIEKAKKTSVEYTSPYAIPMKTRLTQPLTKRELLFYLAHTTASVQAVYQNHFSPKALVLDPAYVFVNGVTSELYFLYVPLTAGGEETTPRDFIETLLYSAIPAYQEDKDCLQRFAYHIKGMKGFEAEKIERFIASEDRSVLEAVKAHHAGGSGYLTNKREEYYKHYEQDRATEDPPATDRLVEEASYVFEDDYLSTGVLDGALDNTGRLDESEGTALLQGGGHYLDDDATGLLSNRPAAHFPTLVRELTEETISINKPVFRIGKERSYVDFFVSNNNAISRSHADIITRGNSFYVMDQNSLNHTYLNNQQIPPKAEVELHDRDILRLANEEFEFHT